MQIRLKQAVADFYTAMIKWELDGFLPGRKFDEADKASDEVYNLLDEQRKEQAMREAEMACNGEEKNKINTNYVKVQDESAINIPTITTSSEAYYPPTCCDGCGCELDEPSVAIDIYFNNGSCLAFNDCEIDINNDGLLVFDYVSVLDGKTKTATFQKYQLAGYTMTVDNE
jgi:hypothetical protein